MLTCTFEDNDSHLLGVNGRKILEIFVSHITESHKSKQTKYIGENIREAVTARWGLSYGPQMLSDDIFRVLIASGEGGR